MLIIDTDERITYSSDDCVDSAPADVRVAAINPFTGVLVIYGIGLAQHILLDRPPRNINPTPTVCLA